MANRQGSHQPLRAAATYAVANVWYPVTTVIRGGAEANTLLLYLTSSVASPGNVSLYLEHSPDTAKTDTTGALGTFFILGSGNESPEVFGPVPFTPVLHGAHTGANNAAVLTFATGTWGINELVGSTIYNTTDGSSGRITANTAITVTATLAGGTDNDWDTGDAFTITQRRSIVVPGMLPLETIRVYFQASANATVAKLAIEGLSYLDESGVATAEISIGDVEVSTEILDDWDAVQHSPAATDGCTSMVEAKAIDGAALPNAVDEGDAVRPAATLSGVTIATLTDIDGSDSPVITADAAPAAGVGTAVVMAGVRTATLDGSAIPTLAGTEGDAQATAASAQGVRFSLLSTADGSSSPVIPLDAAPAAGVGTAGVMAGFTAADFDGAALPAAAGTEGDAAAAKVSLTGIIYAMPVSEDGAQTPLVAHDAAIAAATGGSVGIMQAVEAKDFDGAALPAAVNAEGDAVRPAATLSGVAYTMIVDKIGSGTPLAAHDAAITTGVGTTGLVVEAEAETLGSLGTVDADGDATRIKTSRSGVLFNVLTDPAGAADVGSAIKTAVEVMDDWDESDRAKVSPIAGQAGIAANAGAMDALTTRITIATDDTHLGAVGAAADVDGVLHAQQRFIGEAVAATQTAAEIMDDWDDGADHCEVVNPYKPQVANASSGGAGQPIALTVTPVVHFELCNITIHLSGAMAAAETVAITLNALDGDAYDTVLRSWTPQSEGLLNLAYIPETPVVCENGDEIVIAGSANANNRTWGVRAIWRQI